MRMLYQAVWLIGVGCINVFFTLQNTDLIYPFASSHILLLKCLFASDKTD